MVISHFDADDFRGLRYNIYSVTKDILSSREGKGLSKIESFLSCTRPDKDKLIRYIVFLYSKESPFVSAYKELGQRMRECAREAGYDLVEDKSIVDKLFQFKVETIGEEEEENPQDVEFVNMVIDFLKNQNDLTWSMIVSNEQTFYEYQEALVQSVNLFKNDRDKLSAIQVKTKLMEDSDAIAERLDKYYKKIFSDETVIKRVKQSYTPENIAKRK
jgi:hypothetical protein